MSKLKTVWDASQELAFVKYVRSELDKVTDDEDALRDTLEGELEVGQFDGIMNTLVHEYHTANAIAEGRRAYASQLAEAAKASEEYAGRIKAMIDQGMRDALQDSWKGVTGTISVTQGRLGVEVTDETKLFEYMKPVLQKSLLNEAMLARHANYEAIMNEATLSAAEKKAAIAKLPVIEGAEVVRNPDFIVIRKPAGKKKADAT